MAAVCNYNNDNVIDIDLLMELIGSEPINVRPFANDAVWFRIRPIPFQFNHIQQAIGRARRTTSHKVLPQTKTPHITKHHPRKQYHRKQYHLKQHYRKQYHLKQPRRH